MGVKISPRRSAIAEMTARRAGCEYGTNQAGRTDFLNRPVSAVRMPNVQPVEESLALLGYITWRRKCKLSDRD